MKSRTEFATYVENNDHIVEAGEVIGYVYMVNDIGDHLVFDVVNEDGEHIEMPYAPFDEVTIVESFEDEDDEEVDTDSEL